MCNTVTVAVTGCYLRQLSKCRSYLIRKGHPIDIESYIHPIIMHKELSKYLHLIIHTQSYYALFSFENYFTRITVAYAPDSMQLIVTFSIVLNSLSRLLWRNISHPLPTT